MGTGAVIAGAGMVGMDAGMVVGGLGAAAAALGFQTASEKIRELDQFRQKYGLSDGQQEAPATTAPKNDFKGGTSLDI